MKKKCFDCWWKHTFPFTRGKEGAVYSCELPESNRRKYKNHSIVNIKTIACKYFKKDTGR